MAVRKNKKSGRNKTWQMIQTLTICDSQPQTHSTTTIYDQTAEFVGMMIKALRF